jgi:hypothetical protein
MIRRSTKPNSLRIGRRAVYPPPRTSVPAKTVEVGEPARREPTSQAKLGIRAKPCIPPAPGSEAVRQAKRRVGQGDSAAVRKRSR